MFRFVFILLNYITLFNILIKVNCMLWHLNVIEIDGCLESVVGLGF